MAEDSNVKFWLSRKFWYSVMAAAIFLALALTRTVVFTNEQVMTFILGLVGITIGGHTLTNIGALVAQALTPRSEPAAETETETEAATATATTPDTAGEEANDHDAQA